MTTGKRASGSVWIGTSGWSYKSWRGPFYPQEIPARSHLDHYAKHFKTTELNGVFYRTPTIEAVKSWATQTPDDFVFAWKASKFITHWKRLNENSRSSLDLLESRLRLLGQKAGPILFQLPPHFQKNRERLAIFLKLLNRKRRHVFEFRHPSWYDEDIFYLLEKHRVALCVSDHHDAPSPWNATADYVYVRAHGPGGRYQGHYSTAKLGEIADWLRKQRHANRDAYVYFDNDQKSAAPADAQKLVALVAEG
jgi:uncharacterized protein YecE (DUF72 family)